MNKYFLCYSFILQKYKKILTFCHKNGECIYLLSPKLLRYVIFVNLGDKRGDGMGAPWLRGSYGVVSY